MITRPSSAQLLRTVSHELREVVVPAVADEAVSASVRMMAAVVDAVAVRCEHELDWMAAETAAIVAVADRVSAAAPGAGELAEALAVLRAKVGEGGVADYERASEVLSCAAEVVFVATLPELRTEVENLLAARLAHEIETIGEGFRVIGRG